MKIIILFCKGNNLNRTFIVALLCIKSANIIIMLIDMSIIQNDGNDVKFLKPRLYLPLELVGFVGTSHEIFTKKNKK